MARASLGTAMPHAAAKRRSTRLSAQSKTDASGDNTSPPLPQSRKRKRKAEASSPAPTPPVTPTKKSTHAANEPSSTASSRVAMIADAVQGGKRARNAAVVRLADPELSNAALLSPETCRVVASKDVKSISPSKVRETETTTKNLLQKACDHLVAVDARLRPLIANNHCKLFSPEGLAEKVDPFESLASGIMSQQVSGAAAKAIKNKFIALFADGHADGEAGGRFPHPSAVARSSVERLRTAGLSQRKAEYIQGLAEKFSSGALSADMLHDAPYEDLVEKLVAVRGLGRWSVEMFACFALKRMDVFSVGDLGVQRGMTAFMGRDVAKLRSKGGKWKYMSESEMLEISGKFAPYRSLFMWLMWKADDSVTDVSTLE